MHYNFRVFELNVHLNRTLLSFLLAYLLSFFFSSRIWIYENTVDISLDVDSSHDILIYLRDFDKSLHLWFVLLHELLQLIIFLFVLCFIFSNYLIVIFSFCLNNSLQLFDFLLVLLYDMCLLFNLFLLVCILHLSVSQRCLYSLHCDLKHFLLIKHFWVLFSHRCKLLNLEITLVLVILNLKFELPNFLSQGILF